MTSRTLLTLTVSSIMALGAFAGCLDEAGKNVPGPTQTPDVGLNRTAVYEAIKGLMAGVKCEAPFDASKTTDNLKLLANITATSEAKALGSKELDVRGDILLTALNGHGIGLFNISNPLKPVQLSTLAGTGHLDAKFGPDNGTAFAGSGSGIAIIDIRNLSAPVQTSQWKFDEAPQPPRAVSPQAQSQNAHMLFTARIKGDDWLFLAPNTNSGIWILKITGEPGAKKLTFVTNTLPVQGGPLGPHDMVVQYDVDLKKHVLYSADGFHGWTAFDVSDPSKPTLIGGIVRPETSYTHTIQAVKIGNRRIVATIQEVGANFLEVYDATILTAPVLIATWTHTLSKPTDPSSPTNAQHNINIVDGRLYMAHYGNGVFVFDLKKLGATPGPIQPVAHYGGKAGPTSLFEQFYDVVVKDGVVYAASYGGPTVGIHVIGDGCLAPGDEKLTSIG